MATMQKTAVGNIASRLRASIRRHREKLAMAAAFFVLLAGLAVFWYIVFSGFAMPVQSVYSNF